MFIPIKSFKFIFYVIYFKSLGVYPTNNNIVINDPTDVP